MDAVFAWSPIKSDYIWTVLLGVPAATQLILIRLGVFHFRARLSTLQAMNAAFIALLIGMMNIATTGIPVYSMLAIGNLFAMAHLIQLTHGLHE